MSDRSHPPTPPEQTRARMRDAVADIVHGVKEERARTEAEKLADQERLAARARRRWLWLGLSAVAFAGGLAWALPRWDQPFAPPTGAVAERGAQETLIFAARVIEGFRAQHGRYPASLQETGVALPGITLETGATGWVLSIEVDGRALALRSSEFRP